MFVVLYTFTIKKDCHQTFEKAWADLTMLIFEYEGSLGSRLHKKNDDQYIAYAQWPDEAVWKNSGSKLPDDSILISKTMKDCCEKIETLFELEVVNDLLK